MKKCNYLPYFIMSLFILHHCSSVADGESLSRVTLGVGISSTFIGWQTENKLLFWGGIGATILLTPVWKGNQTLLRYLWEKYNSGSSNSFNDYEKSKTLSLRCNTIAFSATVPQLFAGNYKTAVMLFGIGVAMTKTNWSNNQTIGGYVASNFYRFTCCKNTRKHTNSDKNMVYMDKDTSRQLSEIVTCFAPPALQNILRSNINWNEVYVSKSLYDDQFLKSANNFVSNMLKILNQKNFVTITGQNIRIDQKLGSLSTEAGIVTLLRFANYTVSEFNSVPDWYKPKDCVTKAAKFLKMDLSKYKLQDST